ncbi:AMP-binding protein [Nocardia sp. NPDC051990]|uniref:AMP-binding protein n=1 Tax=Nocardia sp. NPDC051990 TaxID=3155285 RepID=UPI00341DAA33
MRDEPSAEAGVLHGTSFVPAAELEQRAARAASGLAQAGIAAGETIAILMRNDQPFFEASFAAAQLGAAPVPINWHGTQKRSTAFSPTAGRRCSWPMPT